jgi:hypothetical protein
MDPLTLFALANTAVAAVKKGCQLYKDIKSAAGDVKGVLKDLDDQFHKLHPPNRPPTAAQVKQLNEKKAEVKELNRRSADATNVYTEIGDALGQYYDNYFKCLAVLEDEEKRSKTEVYTGGDSLAKRALKRVLMKKQLEQMGTELRELMIYQSPPELGALFTEVESMTQELGQEQRVLMAQEITRANRRRQRMQKYQFEFALGVAVLIAMLIMGGFFMWVAYDAQRRWGNPTQYRDTLAAVKKQEWYERQRRLQEYQEFLAQRQRQTRPDESDN